MCLENILFLYWEKKTNNNWHPSSPPSPAPDIVTHHHICLFSPLNTCLFLSLFLLQETHGYGPFRFDLPSTLHSAWDMWTLNGHLPNERTDSGHQDFVSFTYTEFTVKLDLSFACIIRAESLSDSDFMLCKAVFGKPWAPLLTHSRPWNCLHLGRHKALCVQMKRKIKAIKLRKFYFSHLWANISSSTYTT